MKRSEPSEISTIPAEWREEFEAAARRPLETRLRYAFIHTISLFWTMLLIAPSERCRSTGTGVKKTCLRGLAMGGFEYRQATEIRDALARHQVRYLFIGKSGAILLGFPDTTLWVVAKTLNRLQSAR